MVALDADLDFDFEGEIVARDALKSRQQESRQNAPNQATKYFHTVVCKHWLRNMCIKGEKCDFLHQYDPDRMPECLQWIRHGVCKDPGCLFKHVKDDTRQDCQRYKQGFCKMGSNCRNRHERIPYAGLPEIIPDWFLDQILDKSELVPRLDQYSKEQLAQQDKEMQIISLVPQQPQQPQPLKPPSNVEQLKAQIEQTQLQLQEIQRRNQEKGLTLPNELYPPGVRPPMPSSEEHPGPCPGLPPPADATTKFFVIRSPTMRNIQISAFRAIWASTRGNTTMFQRVFKTHDHIIIIFACTEVKQFLGYAKMVSAPDEGLCPGIWGEFSTRLGDNFRVHWIKQCQLPFNETDTIRNPMNENLPVRKSRDGMELPLPVGQLLTKTLWGKPDNDLLVGTEWEKSERTVYDLKSWTKGTKPEPVAFRSVAPVGTFDNANKRPTKEKTDHKSLQERQQQEQLKQQVQQQIGNMKVNQGMGHDRFKQNQSWPSKPIGDTRPWAALQEKPWNPNSQPPPTRPQLALQNMTPSRPPPMHHSPPAVTLTPREPTENVWRPPTGGAPGNVSPAAPLLQANPASFMPPQRPPLDIPQPPGMGFQPLTSSSSFQASLPSSTGRHVENQAPWRPPPAAWVQRPNEEAWRPPTAGAPDFQCTPSPPPQLQQQPSPPKVQENDSGVWRPPSSMDAAAPSAQAIPPVETAWKPPSGPPAFETPVQNVVENQVWTPSMSHAPMDNQPFIPPSVPFIPPPTTSQHTDMLSSPEGIPRSKEDDGRARASDRGMRTGDRVKKEPEDEDGMRRVKREPEDEKKEKKKDKKHEKKHEKEEKKEKKKEKKEEKKDKKRNRSSSRSRSRSRKRKRSRSRHRYR